MKGDELKEILLRPPVCPLEIATTSGDHFLLASEDAVLNSSIITEIIT